MATVTVTATSFCAGGNHVQLTLAIDGVERANRNYLVSELIDAIQGTDADDVIRTLIRLHKIGKTAAQVKTDLQLGLNVVV